MQKGLLPVSDEGVAAAVVEVPPTDTGAKGHTFWYTAIRNGLQYLRNGIVPPQVGNDVLQYQFANTIEVRIKFVSFPGEPGILFAEQAANALASVEPSRPVADHREAPVYVECVLASLVPRARLKLNSLDKPIERTLGDPWLPKGESQFAEMVANQPLDFGLKFGVAHGCPTRQLTQSLLLVRSLHFRVPVMRRQRLIVNREFGQGAGRVTVEWLVSFCSAAKFPQSEKGFAFRRFRGSKNTPYPVKVKDFHQMAS